MRKLYYNDLLKEVVERFELWSVLGEGANGLILRVRDRASNGNHPVNGSNGSRNNFKAIKIMRKTPNVPTIYDEFFGSIPYEAWIMMVCHHDGILKLDWIYQDSIIELPANLNAELERQLFDRITRSHSPTSDFFFDSNLLQGYENVPFSACVEEKPPDLFEYVEDHFPMPEEKVKDIIGQIVTAVDFLHCHGLYHGDIKDENVLIDEEGKVKMIDFGASRRIPLNNQATMYNGTPNFTCPEVLMGHPYDPRKSDCWAVGVILYILCTGSRPFNSYQEVLHRTPQLGGVSRQVGAIISGCLQKDPNHRLNLSQVLRMIKEEWSPPRIDSSSPSVTSSTVSPSQDSLHAATSPPPLMVPLVPDSPLDTTPVLTSVITSATTPSLPQVQVGGREEGAGGMVGPGPAPRKSELEHIKQGQGGKIVESSKPAKDIVNEDLLNASTLAWKPSIHASSLSPSNVSTLSSDMKTKSDFPRGGDSGVYPILKGDDAETVGDDPNAIVNLGAMNVVDHPGIPVLPCQI